jgi:hypothetical protein
MSDKPKTVKLVGPVDVYLNFTVDGKTYVASNGTVTPDLPEGQVPPSLWGYGFVVQEEVPAKGVLKPKADQV